MSAGSQARRFKQRSRLQHCASCQRREKKISNHMARFREKSRITARAGPCPDDPFCAGNIVELTDLRAPSSDVAPNVTVPVEVDLKNHGANVGTFDPDLCGDPANHCEPGGSIAEGVCVKLVFTIEWGIDSEKFVCSRISSLPPRHETFTVALPSSSAIGTFDVSVRVELDASGDRSRTLTDSVKFSEGGTDNPNPDNGDTNGDDPDSGGGPFLPCLLDPNRSCESAADTILQGGFLILLLLVVIGQAI